MHARRTRIFFPEQECNLVTVIVWLNLVLILGKLCKVHMRMFKLLLIAMFITGQNN